MLNQVTLDTVLTVAVGRNGADGAPMSGSDWEIFRSNLRTVLSDSDTGGLVVCEALSVQAVGSDGVNEGADEESAVFIVVNPADEATVRLAVRDELQLFGQTSACFSVDHLHEPVFAGTRDGYRPRLALEDFTAEGRARRTHP